MKLTLTSCFSTVLCFLTLPACNDVGEKVANGKACLTHLEIKVAGTPTGYVETGLRAIYISSGETPPSPGNRAAMANTYGPSTSPEADTDGDKWSGVYFIGIASFRPKGITRANITVAQELSYETTLNHGTAWARQLTGQNLADAPDLDLFGVLDPTDPTWDRLRYIDLPAIPFGNQDIYPVRQRYRIRVTVTDNRAPTCSATDHLEVQFDIASYGAQPTGVQIHTGDGVGNPHFPPAP